ncbi:MAG: hypothetical protein AABZ47_18515 [Planctomycetota bacterium]
MKVRQPKHATHFHLIMVLHLGFIASVLADGPSQSQKPSSLLEGNLHSELIDNPSSRIPAIRGGDGCKFDENCVDDDSCTVDQCNDGHCQNIDIGQFTCGPTGPFCPLGSCNFKFAVCVCQVQDCNNNDIPDDQDIASGTSQDCDQNGTPDECGVDVCFTGECTTPDLPPLNRWSCPDNWALPGEIFPDNVRFQDDSYRVVLEIDADDNQLDDVFLDVDVTIDGLTLIDSTILRVTQNPVQSAEGDLTIATPEGLTNGGHLFVGFENRIMVPTGLTTLAAGGIYQADPEVPSPVSAVLQTRDLLIREGPRLRASGPGTMILTSGMGVEVEEDATFDGTGAESCADKKGNCRPPVGMVTDGASFSVGGNLQFINSVQFTHSSTVPVVIGGSFENGSQFPECFSCQGMKFGGAGRSLGITHGFEAAGVDRGPIDSGYINNFALGQLEVAAGHTLIVRNQLPNTVGVGACMEALYVNQLILRAGSTLVLDNCRLYARVIFDEGGSTTKIGCADLVSTGCLRDTDCADADPCTSDTCRNRVCLHNPITDCGLSETNRGSSSAKGSVLVYPDVEIEYQFVSDQGGNRFVLSQDTFLSIVNDYPEDVDVQFYFVNGDPPRDGVFVGDPPVLVERSHPGWNFADCQVTLTGNQPQYWSSNSGLPLGCQPITILDPGLPPGRPDPDGRPATRVFRGFVVAWAVDRFGREVSWNHLSGSAVVINYADSGAWEYNAYAVRALGIHGERIETSPGSLDFNGIEYERYPAKLLFDFLAANSTVLSTPQQTLSVDTDLTLLPSGFDFRGGGQPTTTLAVFDIWNQNEIRFSGTSRCVRCWDQTLLRRYNAPNHFLLQNLHTDRGRARIDGLASSTCPQSQPSPLLAVAVRRILFTMAKANPAVEFSASLLPGLGAESATIWVGH